MALKRQDWDAADDLAKNITELEVKLELSRPTSGLQTPSTAEDAKASSSALGAAGGDAIWRMKERNKEVLRQALEAAKKEAAASGADKQRKKAKLEATASGQQPSYGPSFAAWLRSSAPTDQDLPRVWPPQAASSRPTRKTSTWRPLSTMIFHLTVRPRAASLSRPGRRTASASAR